MTFHAVEEKRIVFKHSMFGINNLKIEDSGTYSCIATSVIGQANATIRLVVIGTLTLIVYYLILSLSFGMDVHL